MWVVGMKTLAYLAGSVLLAQASQPSSTNWSLEGLLLQYGPLVALVAWYVWFQLPRQQKAEEDRLAADREERKEERETWEGTIDRILEEAKATRMAFESTLNSYRQDKADELNAASAKLDQARLKLEECLQRKAT